MDTAQEPSSFLASALGGFLGGLLGGLPLGGGLLGDLLHGLLGGCLLGDFLGCCACYDKRKVSKVDQGIKVSWPVNYYRTRRQRF